MSVLVNISYPDLQFDPLVILVYGLNFEVNAHCADEGWREGIICIAEQEGCLPYAAVADDEQLEHVVEILVSSFSFSLDILSGSHLPKQK